MSKSKDEHWYAEVDVLDNEKFAGFMTDCGIGEEGKRTGLRDANKATHHVWYLNGSGLTIRYLRKIKQDIPSLRLYKKTGLQTNISDVTFLIERKKKPAKMIPAKKLKVI